MSRRSGGKHPDTNPGVKPVKKIELSEKSPVKRIIIVVVLLAVGLSLMGVSIYNCVTEKAGWTEIEAENTTDTIASDVTFTYELGVDGRSPTSEKRALKQLYTTLCLEAFQIFEAEISYEDVNNVYYLNHHVGETVTVDPVLYDAFALLERYESRLLYAAPYYREWSHVFTATDDGFAAETDPYKSADVAAYFSELAAFTSREEHVKVQLLGDNTVRLFVSDAYLAFAEEEGITNFIDFYWAKNAFAVDYVADALIAEGFIYGTISSHDGYIRSMDTREDTEYACPLYTSYEGEVYRGANFCYTQEKSIVFLHNYAMKEEDMLYYEYADGTRRSAYVDPMTGYCKSARQEMILHSSSKGCAETLLAALPVYMSDLFSKSALDSLTGKDVYAFYFEGTTLESTDVSAVIRSLLASETITFYYKENKS